MDRIKEIINEEISAINRDKKQEIFDYHSITEDSWSDPKTDAQKFQRINFDFENDESVAKKTFFIKVMLRKDQPVKNEINVDLRIAGGDWEMGVLYFRIEFTHQYGLLSNKFSKDPEFVWDVGDKEGYLSTGKRFVLIPPVEAGNKLIKGESDSGKYDWHAYQNSELSKEEEKEARLTDNDKRDAWRWLEVLLRKLVHDRHEMLDEPDEVEIGDSEEATLDEKKDPKEASIVLNSIYKKNKT